jgi:hypothetical protein
LSSCCRSLSWFIRGWGGTSAFATTPRPSAGHGGVSFPHEGHCRWHS